MSYDLLVFDATSVPLSREAFLAWHAAVMERDENAREDGASPGTAPIRSWYSAMVQHFPPLHLVEGATIDEARITEYTIGPNFVRADFAWSVAHEAFTAMRARAEENRLSLYNVSSPVREVYACNSAGRLRPLHADAVQGAPYRYAIWKRSATTKTAMLESCYEAITRGETHDAMDVFDAREIDDEIRKEFQVDLGGPARAVGMELLESSSVAWLLVSCHAVLAPEVSSYIVPLALQRELMVYDPQRGAVWGNRRPPAMRKKPRV
jgi:hypothetical protein